MTVRRPAGDAGTSLTELLVSMVLTSLVVTLVAATFISSVRTTRISQQKLTQTGSAVVALDAMSRRLRVAVVPAVDPAAPTTTPVAFETATASGVTFYAVLQRGTTTEVRPTRVVYSISTTRGCLLETMTKASGTTLPYAYLPADTTSRCLAFGAIGTQLFTYYPDGASTTALGDATGSVAAADLCRIRSVRVALTVTGGTVARGSTLISRLTMPNILATSCGGT